MAKKKELYTLSIDGEVLSGTVRYKSDKSVILDLGEGEALVVRNPIDVFETEQEAINEAVEEDLTIHRLELTNIDYNITFLS